MGFSAEGEEAVEELIARMLDYRKYKDASEVLSSMFETQRGSDLMPLGQR